MKIAKKICRIFFLISLIFCITIFALIIILIKTTDRNYKINSGDILEIDTIVPITAVYGGVKMSQSTSSRVGESFSVELKMFGVIPFSVADVEVVDEMYVAVLGNPFGMKIYTKGVLVVEISDVETENGKANPAENAGLRVGDYIKSVNGELVNCNEDLAEIVLNSKGESLNFEILRNDETINLNIKPVKDKENGVFRVGIWVKDSSAGIGTLTFYSPKSGIVCGLGHGICDGDSDSLLSIESGELVGARIVSVTKGTCGSPGELKGSFTYDTISDITLNSDCGVYGYLKGQIQISTLTEIALKQEIK
ncbi:MAG: PDZ domain-containing protein, partial [Clostridia bacterium]|nr:PDZ domain-containing protein [Clostridia bacterium]